MPDAAPPTRDDRGVEHPGELYAAALHGDPALVARDADGSTRVLDVARWLGTAHGADERVLARAVGPVLDVGCGPGRHVHALARRGVLAVGVDVSPDAVRLARERGARVLEASVFDRLPGAGTWRSALLLDGNIGIGGSPAALLARVAALLAPGGQALLELEEPGTGVVDVRMRLEVDRRVSRWFDWARVCADAIDGPARSAGLRVLERWHDEGRWFAALETA